MTEYGINKAALGVRYLIKYIESGKEENFQVVIDCLDEIKLWCLITSYCNNIDELFLEVPDFVLDNIFNTRTPKGTSFSESYGRGFKSNSNASSKEQFIKIRALLSHGKFNYENGMISVFDREYEATFDIKWLERLTSVTLSNRRLGLKKGMSDISIMSLVSSPNISIKDFKEYIDNGSIQLYKVTSLSSNREAIVDAMPFKVIDSKELTFETIFQTSIGIMRSRKLNIFNTLEENKKELKKFYKEIEECFGNKIKVEDLPIKIDDKLLEDPLFINLSFQDKLKYLVRIASLDDRVRYNSIMIQNLFEMFESFRTGEINGLNVYALRDAKDFLLKVYANIFFTGVHDKRTSDIAKNYDLSTRYVYAANVYKEYLKVIKRSYEELVKYNGGDIFKARMLDYMNTYSKLLDEAISKDAFIDFSWKMRNSIIHNNIEYKDDMIRFFTTGKNMKLSHYNKKTNTWDVKEFSNKRVIWEMIISSEELIRMLDDFYKLNNIEVNVNISKYVKRKGYLR